MAARGIRAGLALGLALASLAAGCGGSEEPIRIGVLSDCEGLAAGLWDSTLAAAELPLLERGASLSAQRPDEGLVDARVAGRPVDLVFGCDDTNLPNTLAEARRLVETEQVDVLIGPLLGIPGLVVREYARLHPDVAFVSGPSDTQAMTLQDPQPNVYRFTPADTQSVAGLGAYAYHELGWRRAVTMASDDAYGWDQAAAFAAEFCSLGGTIVDRLWAPYYAADLGPLADELPDPIAYDGVAVPGGPVAIGSFVARLAERTPDLRDRLVLGAAPASDPAFLEQLGARLDGVVAASPVPFDSAGPAWDAYVQRLRAAFPEALAGTSYDIPYYDAMEAVLTALERVDGDLSGGESRFMSALAGLRLDSPVGTIRLDENRQYVGPTFLSTIELADGRPVLQTTRVVQDVEQTFGGLFATTSPPVGRAQPACRPGSPPPWAQS